MGVVAVKKMCGPMRAIRVHHPVHSHLHGLTHYNIPYTVHVFKVYSSSRLFDMQDSFLKNFIEIMGAV